MVFVSGCVEEPGEVDVPRFAKLRRALIAAGGIKRRFLLQPSGVVIVRSGGKRPIAGRVRHRIDFRANPSCLDRVRVRGKDRVVVQFGPRLYWWLGRTPDAIGLRK